MTERKLMRMLQGFSLPAIIAHNQAGGFEGMLRNGELYVEVEPSLQALFVNEESAEIEKHILFLIGDRLRKLRSVLGRRLEEYALLIWLLAETEPFERVLQQADFHGMISAAEFMDRITWDYRNPPDEGT